MTNIHAGEVGMLYDPTNELFNLLLSVFLDRRTATLTDGVESVSFKLEDFRTGRDDHYDLEHYFKMEVTEDTPNRDGNKLAKHAEKCMLLHHELADWLDQMGSYEESRHHGHSGAKCYKLAHKLRQLISDYQEQERSVDVSRVATSLGFHREGEEYVYYGTYGVVGIKFGNHGQSQARVKWPGEPTPPKDPYAGKVVNYTKFFSHKTEEEVIRTTLHKMIEFANSPKPSGNKEKKSNGDT